MPRSSEELRLSFGKVFRIWFSRNNWPQDVPHKLSEFVPTKGPWNSQISVCMSGRLDPKVGFFLSCGAFNKQVAEQDFPGVGACRLREHLTGAEPLRLDSGDPFDAADFFRLYTGLIEVPLAYRVADLPVLSDADAKAKSQLMREAFQAVAAHQMLSPKAAWESLEPFAPASLRDVLSGWSEYTAEELTGMPSNQLEYEYTPQMSLVTWALSFDTETSTVLRNIMG